MCIRINETHRDEKHREIKIMLLDFKRFEVEER